MDGLSVIIVHFPKKTLRLNRDCCDVAKAALNYKTSKVLILVQVLSAEIVSSATASVEIVSVEIVSA